MAGQLRLTQIQHKTSTEKRVEWKNELEVIVMMVFEERRSRGGRGVGMVLNVYQLQYYLCNSDVSYLEMLSRNLVAPTHRFVFN